MKISSELSHASFPIELVRESDGVEVAKSHATGFLWRRGDNHFLVTNLHNLAGWDFVRGRALSPSGFLPNRVNMWLSFGSDTDAEGRFVIQRHWIGRPIQRDERPLWLIHPIHQSKVDVAVLPLGSIQPTRIWPDDDLAKLVNLRTQPINTISNWTDFDIDPGDDAFALGFPLGLDGGRGFPLWKRASVASEPDIDVDGLPKALIDTATRIGMSGSPVIATKRGVITPRGAPATLSGETIFGTASTFFGIYSGRVDDDPLGAQIGIVWKARVVDEIIDGSLTSRPPWEI